MHSSQKYPCIVTLEPDVLSSIENIELWSTLTYYPFIRMEPDLDVQKLDLDAHKIRPEDHETQIACS